MKTLVHPSAIYEGVVATHRATLSRYDEANSGRYTNDEVANRCETVLNVTMSELDIYHTQKNEDLRKLVSEHLDGEIQLYEQVTCRLSEKMMS